MATSTQQEKELIEHPSPGTPVKYGLTNTAIAKLNKKFKGMTAANNTECKAVAAGITEVRTLRTSVEKKRKELKADALEWGRKVDGEAKRITELLLEIEDPLKATKKVFDDEKARIKAEKDRIEKERVDGIKELITKHFSLHRIENLQAESSTLIRARIAGFEGQGVDKKEFQEFVEEAYKAKFALLEAAQAIHANRIQFEQEEAERKEEDARLEKERKELEEGQARLREAQAKQEEEQARIDEEKQTMAEQCQESAPETQEGVDQQEAGEPTINELPTEIDLVAADESTVANENQEERSELTALLAVATHAREDFDNSYTDILVTIGKGMLWSKEFDMAARDLADKINAELPTS